MLARGLAAIGGGRQLTRLHHLDELLNEYCLFLRIAYFNEVSSGHPDDQLPLVIAVVDEQFYAAAVDLLA